MSVVSDQIDDLLDLSITFINNDLQPSALQKIHEVSLCYAVLIKLFQSNLILEGLRNCERHLSR